MKIFNFFDKLIDQRQHNKDNVFLSNYADTFSPTQKVNLSEPKTVAAYILENTKNENLRTKHRSHKARIQNEWINPNQAVNSGLGSANWSFFNYQPVNYEECSFLSQDPLMNNIFDILTVSPLANGGSMKIYGDDGEEIEDKNLSDFIKNKLTKKFKVKENLEKAIKSSYIYGGCLLYLDYGDNSYLETPLNLEMTDQRKFRGFRLIDPLFCSPLEVNAYDAAREDYMEPTKWFVVGLGTVHRSRFLKFEWNTPPVSMKPLCNYFGMPYSLLLKQDVANANLVSQGLANLVNKIRRTYIKMDKQVFASGNMPAVMNRLRLMQEVENNFTVFPIDFSEDIVQLTTSLTGIRETIEIFFDILSSKTGIPRNKLKGASTGGLNANTSQVESDKNFSDKIKSIQESLIKDKLVKMLQVVAGSIDNRIYDIDYEFEPLYTMSMKDTGETINTNMDIALKMRQLGINTEDCVNWLKNNETNNMSNISLDNIQEETEYENNQ